MGFAMRMPLNEEIIKKESIKDIYINKQKNGFEFKVQLAYYRGHYLSDIELLEVYMDGEKMPSEAITFELSKKELPLYKVYNGMSEFWSQVEQAKIRVIKEGGLSLGEHTLTLKLMLRIPYMEMGPEHQFMPLDSGDTITFAVTEGGECI